MKLSRSARTTATTTLPSKPSVPAPPPTPPAARRPKRAVSPGVGFLLPFGLLFTGCFVAPIGYAIYQSLLRVERSGALGLGGEHEVFAGFTNYTRAIGDDRFIHGFGRVLLFGIVQVPLMIALATGLALLLESAAAHGVAFFRSSYFLPYGVPGVIASILWGFLYVPGISPLVDLFHGAGWNVDFLSDSSVLWSIANIVTWQFTGYNMLVLIAQLKSIPDELYEAAIIDGAGAWQVAWRVKLPLIRPALVLTAVFSIIGTLQLFSEPLVLRSLTSNIDTGYTPNLLAYNEAFAGDNYHQAAAEAVLLALVACVLSFGFLRLVGRASSKGETE